MKIVKAREYAELEYLQRSVKEWIPQSNYEADQLAIAATRLVCPFPMTGQGANLINDVKASVVYRLIRMMDTKVSEVTPIEIAFWNFAMEEGGNNVTFFQTAELAVYLLEQFLSEGRSTEEAFGRAVDQAIFVVKYITWENEFSMYGFMLPSHVVPNDNIRGELRKALEYVLGFRDAIVSLAKAGQAGYDPNWVACYNNNFEAFSKDIVYYLLPRDEKLSIAPHIDPPTYYVPQQPVTSGYNQGYSQQYQQQPQQRQYPEGFVAGQSIFANNPNSITGQSANRPVGTGDYRSNNPAAGLRSQAARQYVSQQQQAPQDPFANLRVHSNPQSVPQQANTNVLGQNTGDNWMNDSATKKQFHEQSVYRPHNGRNRAGTVYGDNYRPNIPTGQRDPNNPPPYHNPTPQGRGNQPLHNQEGNMVAIGGWRIPSNNGEKPEYPRKRRYEQEAIQEEVHFEARAEYAEVRNGNGELVRKIPVTSAAEEKAALQQAALESRMKATGDVASVKEAVSRLASAQVNEELPESISIYKDKPETFIDFVNTAGLEYASSNKTVVETKDGKPHLPCPKNGLASENNLPPLDIWDKYPQNSPYSITPSVMEVFLKDEDVVFGPATEIKLNKQKFYANPCQPEWIEYPAWLFRCIVINNDLGFPVQKFKRRNYRSTAQRTRFTAAALRVAGIYPFFGKDDEFDINEFMILEDKHYEDLFRRADLDIELLSAKNFNDHLEDAKAMIEVVTKTNRNLTSEQASIERGFDLEKEEHSLSMEVDTTYEEIYLGKDATLEIENMSTIGNAVELVTFITKHCGSREMKPLRYHLNREFTKIANDILAVDLKSSVSIDDFVEDFSNLVIYLNTKYALGRMFVEVLNRKIQQYFLPMAACRTVAGFGEEVRVRKVREGVYANRIYKRVVLFKVSGELKVTSVDFKTNEATVIEDAVHSEVSAVVEQISTDYVQTCYVIDDTNMVFEVSLGGVNGKAIHYKLANLTFKGKDEVIVAEPIGLEADEDDDFGMSGEYIPQDDSNEGEDE